MPTIGVRLPDYLFLRVHDSRRVVRHLRTCKKCKYKWPTAEIALVRDWKGTKFTYCWNHRHTVGYPFKAISITQAKRGKVHSKALYKVCGWGGFYRRRECRAMVASDRKCGARWTTAEVSPDGLIIEDIQKCARCGSVDSRIERRKKKYA